MTGPGFAKALGKIPSGIFIVTAKRGNEECALLASWVQQVSFNPAAVSVAVNKDREMASFLTDGASFALHIVAQGHKELFQRFAKRAPENGKLFEGLEITSGVSGAPILKDALAVLECRVRFRADAGDHHLIVADVTDGQMFSEGEPRVHIRKNGLNY